MSKSLQRDFVGRLLERFKNPPKRLQILIGPRQVGKTYGADQIRKIFGSQAMYVSADQVIPPDGSWLAEQWQQARNRRVRLLIVDEVQKATRWSEVVKMLWDQDVRFHRAFHVLLLGSSSLLMQKGMSESLAGRFELTRCSHWSWPECKKAFGWDCDQWLHFGGYPGFAGDIQNEEKWRSGIVDSMIETVLSRDVLQLQTVTKPALLRQLFRLVCQAPAQIVSYENMLGQLQDAGNTTTLSHYLKLLDSAFLCVGLQKFARGVTREKASSPKLIVHNNALISALNPHRFTEPPNLPDRISKQRAQEKAGWRGRLAENAVGAKLLDFARDRGNWLVTYWRDRGDEVDFVLQDGRSLFAIEVKSGQKQETRGLRRFIQRYPEALVVIIGHDEFPLESFFNANPEELLVHLLKAGLQQKLGVTVQVEEDYGFIAFKNQANGKSVSYPPEELDAQKLIAGLEG